MNTSLHASSDTDLSSWPRTWKNMFSFFPEQGTLPGVLIVLELTSHRHFFLSICHSFIHSTSTCVKGWVNLWVHPLNKINSSCPHTAYCVMGESLLSRKENRHLNKHTHFDIYNLGSMLWKKRKDSLHLYLRAGMAILKRLYLLTRVLFVSLQNGCLVNNRLSSIPSTGSFKHILAQSFTSTLSDASEKTGTHPTGQYLEQRRFLRIQTTDLKEIRSWITRVRCIEVKEIIKVWKEEAMTRENLPLDCELLKQRFKALNWGGRGGRRNEAGLLSEDNTNFTVCWSSSQN